MYKLNLQKPDGRNLVLYSRKPIKEGLLAPSPNPNPIIANPHLRWHPLRGEWVAYASHRQGRTFLPPPEYNPLSPTRSDAFPTELPEGDYDIAVFDNLFPTLSMGASAAPFLPTPTEPALGVCEVVVFTQDSKTSLGKLPLDHIELLLKVWADRYREISKNKSIKYIMPFENRGVEVGVTLHHPHGQLYAYAFVPPIPAKQLLESRCYLESKGRGLLEDMIAMELTENQRLIYRGDLVSSFVPYCARYPYEVWLAPHRRVSSLADLSPSEIQDFARALKTTLLKYDGLWKRPFPYLMVIHQAPVNNGDCPESHLHIQFYPPYRTESRLKFLAGTELGAGLFASDCIPEEKAAELRAVEVSLD